MDDKEQKRWQDEIYERLIKVAKENEMPVDLIDGGGCESGDPLDFTLSEIFEVIIFFVDKSDDLQKQLVHEKKVAENLIREYVRGIMCHQCIALIGCKVENKRLGDNCIQTVKEAIKKTISG